MPDVITGLPAPRLLHHVPPGFAAGIGELLRDAMRAHADAEFAASPHPSCEALEKTSLYAELLALQSSSNERMMGQYIQSVLMDQGGDEWIFIRDASKVKDGGLDAAKSILLGQVSARLDETTSEQM
ncbi:unnamed protein product, partial [Prorocentrum cordatum]